MGLLQTQGWGRETKDHCLSRAGHCFLPFASQMLRVTEKMLRVWGQDPGVT